MFPEANLREEEVCNRKTQTVQKLKGKRITSLQYQIEAITDHTARFQKICIANGSHVQFCSYKDS